MVHGSVLELAYSKLGSAVKETDYFAGYIGSRCEMGKFVSVAFITDSNGCLSKPTDHGAICIDVVNSKMTNLLFNFGYFLKFNQTPLQKRREKERKGGIQFK